MQVNDVHYDYIIVGSGAGGATLARELSKKSKSVLVLERGIRENKIGTFLDAFRYFDSGPLGLPKKSDGHIILWRGLLAGGSAFVATANMTKSLEKEFHDQGIDLAEYFDEAQSDLKVAPIHKRLISKASQAIGKAAAKLGYSMVPMPKAIDSEVCIRCGRCSYGCVTGAKWTPMAYLDEALANGVVIRTNTKVERVTTSAGQVNGVIVSNGRVKEEIRGDKVILAAGGLGTPVILQKSGITEAGDHLFIDLFVNVYGKHESLNMEREPQMTLLCSTFHEDGGFIISPFLPHSRGHRFIEAGLKGFLMPTQNTLGLMVKISDDANGRVNPDGTVAKKATGDDRQKIAAGVAVAKKILIQAGVAPESVIVTKLQGAHPGGTAGIGRIVDNSLETKYKNLYVCDASVLPHSPGMPPILTIVALAKWLAKRI